VLDFGCGCGRVLRHLGSAFGGTLDGTDRSVPAVEWCRSNLPFARFAVTPEAPPLPFADGAFDVVYAFSVFTHLTPALQAAWMKEMSRILGDGGHLLISLHGDSYSLGLHPDVRAEYLRGNLVVLEEALDGSNFCNVFHPEAYVRRSLADGFEVVDFRPSGARGNPTQDLYVLKKL
jgi:SAM-dependent methyltransferase